MQSHIRIRCFALAGAGPRMKISGCNCRFELMLPKVNLWFWNIPIRLSFNVWPSLVDGDEQRVCWRCCDEAAGSPMNISTRGSIALQCCYGRLFASLSTWLACQRRDQLPRLTTPRFPHAPPAGITASAQRAPRALLGPSRPSPSSSGLSSGMAPWWLTGEWRLVDGRPGGGEMRMGSGGDGGRARVW
jgi:hypothetical protein